MSVQIFGKAKCFDTKKAERFFKERGVKYQYVDLLRYGISMGELKSVRAAAGSIEALLSDKEDVSGVTWLSFEQDKLEKLYDDPRLLKTPIVRNGKRAAVGHMPEMWEKL
ncbi:MAG: ArsC family transcriptional regulator, partial [Oscillospiraceae bacterium]|nr:ArsC family transcriptional regulator [Oscillospiraceae bacterium]